MMMRLLLVVLAVQCAQVFGAGLIDDPIVGDSILYLDGKWQASTPGLPTITGNVPGDLITDLQTAGLIGDPLFENNFKNASLWSGRTWTYTTGFSVDEEAMQQGSEVLLVFDGIKMGANILVNGVQIGQAVDQFLRYVFPLSQAQGTLRVGANTLSVVFDESIFVNGRFMACTGGWDWAPYSTTDQKGITTFTKGIWKSVYLVTVSSAAIVHVVPQISYLGSYPNTPLSDGTHGGFGVSVRVHFWTSAAVTGTFTLHTAWGSADVSKQVSLPAGESNSTLSATATAEQIELWWPTGMGNHPLYNLTVSFTPSAASVEKKLMKHARVNADVNVDLQANANVKMMSNNAAVAATATPLSATRRVGFRVFALVTGNDTDPAYVAKNVKTDGTDTMGMLFRVNGAPIFSRGANMIPMEELEGRMNAEAHRQLVYSAADAGMNTLRVWGGGIFLPNIWYDTCDEAGILVYHDMQYAQGGHSPTADNTQDAELRHQVRRLSHHPSIALYDGCNECHVVPGTPTGIYASFVMRVVVEEDLSRVIWPSCPAAGWASGVWRLTSLPDGSPLGLKPRSTPPKSNGEIETHGPYQHGTGFPAVNGNTPLEMFDANIPIKISPQPTGPQLPNVFASEFGCVTMSSFESMSVTLKPEHWGLHGGSAPDVCKGSFTNECTGTNVMAERNYPCDNIIEVYFGMQTSFLNTTGEAAFKKQLFQCMIGQTLNMKSNIETRRATNQFGIVIWQLNEIWPTGGWGSLEYGTPVAGQVIGGRWKPLHYYLMRSLFKDVIVACGANGQCYVKNDGITAFNGDVLVRSVSLVDGSSTTMYAQPVQLAAGAGVSQWFTVDYSKIDVTKNVLVASASTGGACVTENFILLTTPDKLIVQPAKFTIEVASTPNIDNTIDIVVTTSEPALFVTLTTLAQGRFSDNAFLLEYQQTVKFIPFGALDIATLKNTLRIEDLSAYNN